MNLLSGMLYPLPRRPYFLTFPVVFTALPAKALHVVECTHFYSMRGPIVKGTPQSCLRQEKEGAAMWERIFTLPAARFFCWRLTPCNS